MEQVESKSGDIYDQSVFEDDMLLNFLLNGKKLKEDADRIFCHQYVEELSSYSLSKLNGEPEHLKEKHDDLLQQTQSLAYENYQTFIQAANCSKEVYKDFNIIENHLDSLLDNIPSFSNEIEKFSRASQEIKSCRKQNSLVLSKHTQLLEVLEIPQLMETCVRNGYYEEALELSNFVKRLGKKFSSIKIIGDIHQEVTHSTQYMMSQLLQQLTGNIQLPACLRIISYIRQLDVYKEGELRIKFLQARESWFKDLLGQIPDNDAYQHLNKVIEVNRVNLFDIITQYKAIFSDDEPLYNYDGGKHINYAHILQSWVARKISVFIKILQDDLDKGVGSRLDSVFGQCMYFGLSFSRVGADFRGLIIPIFHKFSWKQFTATLFRAARQFEEDIHIFTTTVKRDKKDLMKSTSNDPYSPPQKLLNFPPMASYLNSILTSFNTFRQYPAVPFVYRIKQQLMYSLEKVFIALQNWMKMKQQSYPDSNIEDLKYYCLLACGTLLPFIKTILITFFGVNSLNEMNGRLPSNLNSTQVKAMYILDTESLFNILKDFVEKDDIIESVEAPPEQATDKENNGNNFNGMIQHDIIDSTNASDVINENNSAIENFNTNYGALT